ncbi:TetR/AcrR family transcriptional regulator [Tahibacter amnicola]|uniref:TetR/AcrR family transcriptional regulator n=1 Tax=Tahibacter amnicola TaxID=2976241 RepID=A0ABY6B9N4_9GAMM|nr:TetR/AcrR family transcriptional regulator [Tahibacter amnicola]UXI65900.1 TetR/AcrR family transcriptional regulator [Tahibacter amnicola]
MDSSPQMTIQTCLFHTKYRQVCILSTLTPVAVNPMATRSPARSSRPTAAAQPQALRDHILQTASRLFYTRGVRAVGVDLVIQEAGVAKTSLYRHFPTKDDLIVAFLEREDADFWSVWDQVAEQHADAPMSELEAHMHWIGERLARPNYRGCPQINVAAEFAEPDHPARHVARAHMQALRARLHDLARKLKVPHPQQLAAQLALLINGAFVSAGLLTPEEATDVLLASVRALCKGAGGPAQEGA